jgi:hypothetical protein
MSVIAKARKTHLRAGALACPAGAPPGVSKNNFPLGFSAQTSTFDSGVQQEKNSFLREQTLHVYENKGSVWKAGGGSENVYENKAVIPNIRECH